MSVNISTVLCERDKCESCEHRFVCWTNLEHRYTFNFEWDVTDRKSSGLTYRDIEVQILSSQEQIDG